MHLFKHNGICSTLRPLLSQSKRCKAKINIQKPRAPHFIKATYLELAKPMFPKKNVDLPLRDMCKKGVNFWKKDEIENPFERILANEIYDRFNTARLVAFFHSNPIKAEDKLRAYIAFKKQNMLLKTYGKQTFNMALKNTRFETVLDFYVSHNMVLTSPECEIKKMLKINKKYPQLVLLAGIIEGKLVTKNDLIYYSNFVDIKMAQATLAQTLTNIGSKLLSQFSTHQNILVAQLGERIKQLEDSSDKT